MIANDFLLFMSLQLFCNSNIWFIDLYKHTRQTNKQTIGNGCCLMITDHNITTTSPFFYEESLPYHTDYMNVNMDDK